jgi:hypothetical protein
MRRALAVAVLALAWPVVWAVRLLDDIQLNDDPWEG